MISPANDDAFRTGQSLEALRHEMEEIIARHSALANGYETPVPGLKVARIVEPVPPTSYFAEAWICVCIRGRRAFTFGDAVIAHDETRYLVNTLGLPTIVEVESACVPYTALSVDLDLVVARQVMAEIDLEGVSAVPAAQASLSFGEVDRAFLDAVARLVRLIEAPHDIAFLSGLAHREILYKLLSAPSGYGLRQIVRLGSQGHRVTKATGWLRTHFRERLRIEQLAEIAGMGVSTLHRHFHGLTGMSPIQYQKRLRLHEARRRMLEEDADVGSTALSVGYESTTQFIREYRRLYGEPPRRDVKAMRARGNSGRLS